MLRVGVTGGIGSGKSTVARMMGELGAVVTDADAVARDVVMPGQPALAAIVAEFGAQMLLPDGSLDRARMAELVFADEQQRRVLESITWPAILARVNALRAAIPPEAIDVYDSPLLVERGLWVHEHVTVVVGAPVQTRIERLVGRGMDEADARARLAAQATDTERRDVAEAWIDNSHSLEQTRQEVEKLWRWRLVRHDEALRGHRVTTPPSTVQFSEADARWAQRGVRVVGRLGAAVGGNAVRIDHVGSTAVAGLTARDIIDIQVGVERLTDRPDEMLMAALERAGYVPHDFPGPDRLPTGADPAQWRARTYAGCDPTSIVRVVVREVGSDGWLTALRLRDWLASDAALRKSYGGMKKRWAGLSLSEPRYVAAMQPWVDEADAQSRAWADETGWQLGASVGPG